MRIPATLTLPILTYILCSSISGKNLMFNKTTHSHINIVTRVEEMRTYHVDVRIHTYFKDGRYDGATAVYHKHVPIGLVLDILDVSTLKELAKRWHPDVYRGVVKKGRHEALADIYESIEELRHYRDNFLRLADESK